MKHLESYEGKFIANVHFSHKFKLSVSGHLLYEDNQSCLKLLHGEKLSNRTKHIATRYYFTKNQIKERKISCVYCASEIMIADLLTKPLPRIRLQKLVAMIGLAGYI